MSRLLRYAGIFIAMFSIFMIGRTIENYDLIKLFWMIFCLLLLLDFIKGED